MRELGRELRRVFRAMARRPGPVAGALITLALGLGANTALFTVIDGVLLAPLPYPEPDELVRLADVHRESGGRRSTTSPPDFRDWRRQSESFEALAAFTGAKLNVVGGPRAPERLDGARVTGEFFQALAAEPVLGRTLTPEDDASGAQVAVLGESLWRRRFAADPEVLDRTLRVNGEPHDVVGVLADRHVYPPDTEIWLPMNLQVSEDQRGSRWLRVLARLDEGVGLEEAQAEMDVIAAQLAREHPETNQGWEVRVERLHDLLVEDIRPALLVLSGAVVLVLLITCANVANLLLARLLDRRGEMAVRTALGAGHRGLARLFLVEAMALTTVGAAIGLGLGVWATEILVALSPEAIPRAGAIGFDLAVFLFTAGLAAMIGLVLGLLPSLRASRMEVQPILRGGGQARGGESKRAAGLRAALVVCQFALAVIVVVAAGLLFESFARLQRVQLGFDVGEAQLADLTLPEDRYAEEARQVGFVRELIPRLEALPGVVHAGAVFPIHLAGSQMVFGFFPEGAGTAAPAERQSARIRLVSPGYLRAMGIPLVLGRGPTWNDGPGSPAVALVNRTMAEGIWPGEDPLGKRFTFDETVSEAARWVTVVGVVGDVRQDPSEVEPAMELYLPLLQRPSRSVTLVARTAGESVGLAEPLRQTVQAVDPSLPLSDLRTLPEHVAGSIARERFTATLLGLFALLALVLAGAGVYSMVSYSVNQRTREFGVRLALGAVRRNICWTVVRKDMVPVLLGLAIGLGLAQIVLRWLQDLLFEVESTNLATQAVGLALLVGVALAASYLPARRVSRVDPVTVLREQ